MVKEWRKMTTAERLRAFACFLNNVLAELFLTAADELDELTKENERLREAYMTEPEDGDHIEKPPPIGEGEKSAGLSMPTDRPPSVYAQVSKK